MMCLITPDFFTQTENDKKAILTTDTFHIGFGSGACVT